jgi:hypothetical protein
MTDQWGRPLERDNDGCLIYFPTPDWPKVKKEIIKEYTRKIFEIESAIKDKDKTYLDKLKLDWEDSTPEQVLEYYKYRLPKES